MENFSNFFLFAIILVICISMNTSRADELIDCKRKCILEVLPACLDREPGQKYPPKEMCDIIEKQCALTCELPSRDCPIYCPENADPAYFVCGKDKFGEVYTFDSECTFKLYQCVYPGKGLTRTECPSKIDIRYGPALSEAEYGI